MSNSTIDQLFQITTPTRSGLESSRASQTDGDQFRAHLTRAADAAEPKSPATSGENEPAPIENDEPLEPQTGQQEASTANQEQTAATAESSEPTAETNEESQSTDETTDEVTLSAAAAAQQAETDAAAEQVVSTEGIVEAVSTDGQQESDGQTPAQLTEATNDPSASTAGTEAVELEAALFGEGEAGETASDDGEVRVEAEVVADAAKTLLHPETSQTATVPIVEGEAKKLQSSTSASSNAQQALDKPLPTNDALETLPETESGEGTVKTANGRFDLPTTTTIASNDLAVATDAELALANLNNTSESPANSPSTSTSSTETVAAAGRSLGNLIASKSANTTSATTESPTTETPTVDRARFVQRVGGAIRSAQNRDGQIQLRLSPPELGTLRINIVMKEGVITAHLETETAAARTVLLDNLPALRERLAEQEIRIEKFDVDVGREDQQQTENPENDDRQANRSRSQTNQSSNRDRDPSLAIDESNPTQPVTTSGLDVRI